MLGSKSISTKNISRSLKKKFEIEFLQPNISEISKNYNISLENSSIIDDESKDILIEYKDIDNCEICYDIKMVFKFKIKFIKLYLLRI